MTKYKKTNQKEIQKILIDLLHSGSNLKRHIDSIAEKSVRYYIDLFLYRDGFKINAEINRILTEYYQMGFEEGWKAKNFHEKLKKRMERKFVK